ncbi:hypothetical protein F4810DRAFT_633516 [Camillea tinctor]|nr:hypothetical protein F4810DRAFT_633516 [Camillea tinctor]
MAGRPLFLGLGIVLAVSGVNFVSTVENPPSGIISCPAWSFSSVSVRPRRSSRMTVSVSPHTSTANVTPPNVLICSIGILPASTVWIGAGSASFRGISHSSRGGGSGFHPQ